MKICTKCQIEKPINEFNFKVKAIGKLKSQCKMCDKISRKVSYDKNKKYYLNKTVSRKKEIKIFYKEKRFKQSCSQCGESHPACLDYHHLNNKEGNIAAMIHRGFSKDSIDKEISKCIVLCSNCHRKLHYKP